jgi:hypothetical protein
VRAVVEVAMVCAAAVWMAVVVGAHERLEEAAIGNRAAQWRRGPAMLERRPARRGLGCWERRPSPRGRRRIAHRRAAPGPAILAVVQHSSPRSHTNPHLTMTVFTSVLGYAGLGFLTRCYALGLQKRNIFDGAWAAEGRRVEARRRAGRGTRCGEQASGAGALASMAEARQHRAQAAQ